MMNTDNYIIASLELHLFFARIMKEHALFLAAGFPCKDSSFIKQSDYYKNQFESLLQNVVRLSDGVISRDAIASNEFVTEFTLTTEMQTQNFTVFRRNQINHNYLPENFYNFNIPRPECQAKNIPFLINRHKPKPDTRCGIIL